MLHWHRRRVPSTLSRLPGSGRLNAAGVPLGRLTWVRQSAGKRRRTPRFHPRFGNHTMPPTPAPLPRRSAICQRSSVCRDIPASRLRRCRFRKNQWRRHLRVRQDSSPAQKLSFGSVSMAILASVSVSKVWKALCSLCTASPFLQ